MSEEIGALNPHFMGIIGENISEEIFEQCKKMVKQLEEFTFKLLKKNKKLVISIARDLLKNETIVYERIKMLLPKRLENSQNMRIGSFRNQIIIFIFI